MSLRDTFLLLDMVEAMRADHTKVLTFVLECDKRVDLDPFYADAMKLWEEAESVEWYLDRLEQAARMALDQGIEVA